MDRAASQWAQETQHPLPASDLKALQRQLSKGYTIYGSLLLLNASVLDSAVWKQVARDNDASRRALLECMSHHMKITHIAVTRPIPPRNDDKDKSENVVRSPSDFVTLYGDFGPESCQTPPTPQDFENAYWTTAKQNGISQTWAPRWTMFSRGNVSEKARILGMPSVLEAVEDGRLDGGCAAVDLYAGIGYFTFSYLKAGVTKALCWDVNAWSIEGLVRGARANRWEATVLGEDGVEGEMVNGEARMLVFRESNDFAKARVRRMRGALPPIRHVNCGLLPTSRRSWETAFEVLDPGRGGWVHVHENFAQSEIEQKGEEVRVEFQRMLAAAGGGYSGVVLENINRVKTYAPGVYHVVLDIYVPSRRNH